MPPTNKATDTSKAQCAIVNGKLQNLWTIDTWLDAKHKCWDEWVAGAKSVGDLEPIPTWLATCAGFVGDVAIPSVNFLTTVHNLAADLRRIRQTSYIRTLHSFPLQFLVKKDDYSSRYIVVIQFCIMDDNGRLNPLLNIVFDGYRSSSGIPLPTYHTLTWGEGYDLVFSPAAVKAIAKMCEPLDPLRRFLSYDTKDGLVNALTFVPEAGTTVGDMADNRLLLDMEVSVLEPPKSLIREGQIFTMGWDCDNCTNMYTMRALMSIDLKIISDNLRGGYPPEVTAGQHLLHIYNYLQQYKMAAVDYRLEFSFNGEESTSIESSKFERFFEPSRSPHG